jgi:hexosaminidase
MRNLLIVILFLAACGGGDQTPTSMSQPISTPRSTGTSATSPLTLPTVIPRPVSMTLGPGVFNLVAGATIYIEPTTPEAMAVGRHLAERLKLATGYDVQVLAATDAPPPGSISLTITTADASLGDEGYALTITPDQVSLVAPHPAGLFHAVQTLRQLLPASIEADTVQPGPWPLPAINIRDYPRFEWRGAMLDVARHFFGVEDIQRFIDRMAYYKLNRLHLHLTDDQGWRLAIDSWPNLAALGGSTAVGGDPGGFLTPSEFARIVAYAEKRYVMIVPEIDMPGHTNALLASYPELNCDGVAPPLYTGIEVGFSSLCIGQEATYRFVDDALRELASLTPGPYLHIGGDETQATSEADYRSFVERVQSIVESHGKRMIGWEEIARAKLHPISVAQHWSSEWAARAVEQGLRVILSPATHAYLDMQYDPGTPMGLHWAGYIEVQDAYDWDPATQVPGITEKDVMGVEAPLWTETVRTLADIDFMAFPRLAGIAEVGWSAADAHDWSDFRVRLAGHGPRLSAMGVNFYRSPQIDWR